MLVCDDEPNLRELVRASLADRYRFVEAGSVAEAEQALQDEPPDAVVLDLMIPGGTGLDVLRAVRREAGDHVPVVIVSAWTTPDYRAAAEDAGADAFLSKPFAPDELSAVVARLLEEHP